MQIWVQSRLSGVLPVLASAISLFPLAFENRSAVPYIDNVRMGVREQQQNSAPEVFFLFCFCASCLYTQNKLLVWCNRGPSSRKKCSTAETLIKIQAHCVHFYYLTNFTKKQPSSSSRVAMKTISDNNERFFCYMASRNGHARNTKLATERHVLRRWWILENRWCFVNKLGVIQHVICIRHQSHLRWHNKKRKILE